MRQALVVYDLSSLEEMWSVRGKLTSDADGADPAFDRFGTMLLEAAPYSPEIAPGASTGKPRVFELRVYHSPTYRQLAALHERFAGPNLT